MFDSVCGSNTFTTHNLGQLIRKVIRKLMRKIDIRKAWDIMSLIDILDIRFPLIGFLLRTLCIVPQDTEVTMITTKMKSVSF
jgi:hypothetical protein